MPSASDAMTDLFPRIYVINLAHRKERRERMEKMLEGIADPGKVEFVRACDGALTGVPKFWLPGPGAWGCLQSHLRILEDAMHRKLESYLVLEDDAVFGEEGRDAAMARLRVAFAFLPDDWGQFYLGGQHNLAPLPVSDGLVRGRRVNRTHAFAAHRPAYRTIYGHIANYYDYFRTHRHIDHHLERAHRTRLWETYCISPWLFGQAAGYSDIARRPNEADSFWT